MNQENRLRSRYNHASAQLKKLRGCDDAVSVRQRNDCQKTVDELWPVINHFNQDIAQVKRWRIDKKMRLVNEWILQLIVLAKGLRSVERTDFEYISVGGLELRDINRAVPGFFGSCTKMYIKEQKFGHVDNAGTLFINLRKLSPEILQKARQERDLHLSGRVKNSSWVTSKSGCP